MISVETIRERIQLGNENRNLDYKGAFSWDQANSDQKCEITKDVLAFSNTRDGGMILIGVNDKTGVLEGLTDTQYASFDQTKFNSFVQKYTDPRHTSNVHRIEIDGKRVVVIDVPEFADVPILCAREAHSSLNSSKLILRKAALYKRTEKATSEPINDADDMRELLNRGLLRRQDELLRAIKQIIQPNERIAELDPGAEFKTELESAELYFSELDGAPFAQLPHWTVQIQPGAYTANLIATAIDCQRLIQQSAISLRGWTFPIAGRVTGSGWTNFDGGSQSYYRGNANSPEAMRVYKSGLFIWRSGIWEDYSAFAGQNVLSFTGMIYSVTEWTLFAKRFFETILSVDEGVHLTVSASGIKGRRLISPDPRAHLWEEYRTEEPKFQMKEVVAVSELRSDPEEIARRVIKRIFELFNWNTLDDSFLHNLQQRLIQRQL